MILFGFKGCGKTYFGKRLAEALRVPFLDTDVLIEQKYAEETGYLLTCRQICTKEGDFFFRALERSIIETLTTSHARVIAIGGGTMLDDRNREKLKRLGQLVYLKAHKNILKARLIIGGIPSFLDAENFEASFEKMYAEREPIFESIEAKHVDLDGRSEEEVIRELVQCYGE